MQISRLVHFAFHSLNIWLHSLLTFMVSGEESILIPTLVPWRVRFSSGFFQGFLFVFGFLQCEYNKPMRRVLVLIILGIFWASEICGLVSVINFGKFSAIITSNITCFLPFLSHLSSIPLHIHNSLWHYPAVLRYSVPCCSYFFFSFYFIVQVFTDASSRLLIPFFLFFFFHIWSTLIAYQRHFFISVKMFLTYVISLGFFS